MSTATPTDAEAFQSYLAKEMANGGRDKSPEELVEQWRRQRREFAVRESLAEIDAGAPGRLLSEVAHDIRQKHGWPQNP